MGIVLTDPTLDVIGTTIEAFPSLAVASRDDFERPVTDATEARLVSRYFEGLPSGGRPPMRPAAV